MWVLGLLEGGMTLDGTWLRKEFAAGCMWANLSRGAVEDCWWQFWVMGPLVLEYAEGVLKSGARMMAGELVVPVP